MINFKLFFETTSAGLISPADIFSFYYIYTLKNRLLGSEHNRNTVVSFLNDLQSKYLNTFGLVLKGQILKYLRYQSSGQKRIKDNSELLQIDIEEFKRTIPVNFDRLETYIKNTTRSQRHNFKENEDWNAFAEWLNKLSKKTISAGSINIEGQDNVLFIMDRINNCVHNTGESIFDKVKENGHALIMAFDQAHQIRDPIILKNKSVPEIKELEVSEVQEHTPTQHSLTHDKKSMHSFYKGRLGD